MDDCGGCVYPVMMTSGIQQAALNGVDGSCISASSTHQQVGQEPLLAESPPLLSHAHMQMPPHHNMISPMPFFNLMIPVADNFGGPVNMSVSPSVDPSGADLPVNGKLITAV